jgi:hypothetical protein
MSLDIGRALRDGLDRTTARTGLVVLAVLVGFRLVNGVVQQSLSKVWIGGILDELAADPPSFEGSELTTEEYLDLIEEIRRTVVETTQLSYLESLSVPELLAIGAVLAIVAEAIRIVAVRTFVSPETESIPRELLSRRLGWAVLNGVVGGIAVGILVAVGLILLVVPGIFLAVAFLFLRQEIAVEDKNFVDAMSGSWSLTAGNRIELFGLIVFLVVISLAVSFVVGLFGSSAAVDVVNIVTAAAVLTYSVAVVSRAYDQLRAERGTGTDDAGGSDDGTDEFEDIDDELLP